MCICVYLRIIKPQTKMAKEKKVSKKRLELRIFDVPKSLHDAIKERAKTEYRSISKECLNTLKSIYDGTKK